MAGREEYYSLCEDLEAATEPADINKIAEAVRQAAQELGVTPPQKARDK